MPCALKKHGGVLRTVSNGNTFHWFLGVLHPILRSYTSIWPPSGNLAHRVLFCFLLACQFPLRRMKPRILELHKNWSHENTPADFSIFINHTFLISRALRPEKIWPLQTSNTWWIIFLSFWHVQSQHSSVKRKTHNFLQRRTASWKHQNSTKTSWVFRKIMVSQNGWFIIYNGKPC